MGVTKNYGTIAGWGHVEMRLDGRKLAAITELKYETEQETEPVYGTGTEPIGIAEGNIKYSASIGLLAEEYTQLLSNLSKGESITTLRNFIITCSYKVQSKIYTDRINCYCMKKSGRELKQGDKSLPYTFDIEVIKIEENV